MRLIMKSWFSLALAIACCVGGSCCYAKSGEKYYVKAKDVKLKGHRIFIKTQFGPYEVKSLFVDRKGIYVVKPKKKGLTKGLPGTCPNCDQVGG